MNPPTWLHRLIFGFMEWRRKLCGSCFMCRGCNHSSTTTYSKGLSRDFTLAIWKLFLRAGNCWFRCSCTLQKKCAGAPSCQNHILYTYRNVDIVQQLTKYFLQIMRVDVTNQPNSHPCCLWLLRLLRLPSLVEQASSMNRTIKLKSGRIAIRSQNHRQKSAAFD